MKTVFLCGFMGCGKSACGKICAGITGRSFCDMDDYIVSLEGKTIPEIFSEYGERGFRERETKALRALCGCGGIVACGGGAMVNPANASIANKDGMVIFIDTPFDICSERIKNDSGRPVAAAKSESELRELFGRRRKAYLDASDCIISGEGSAEEIALKIAEAVKRFA